ncbi:FRG domain-containing protein [Sphingobacterium sp. DK4209]|uniref:FRG domain-containing protein n=1 Tax=Sphingobacterium zhuxiongii TaxID=2662364 RepID=A0A5Q0QAT2_9SPHI|nr:MULTISPECIES: FRG domain-containing protein [unclassified Sphingobacterium]MVZ67613.1 FRG domain-containing protein [Sphingobacterium sp. DK4209]QGA26693.1 FRG domain-containing protein [Sphingobacterium sp. dk4302]
MNHNIITSINDYLTYIDKTQSLFIGNLKWYRAENQSYCETLLTPGLFREYIKGPSTTQPFYVKELSTRNLFQLEAYSYLNNENLLQNDLMTTFVMQHYGAETRLLDWSDNALIALFFAVENTRSDNEAIIWVLDPLKLNASNIKEIKNKEMDELKIYTSLKNTEEVDNYFNIHLLEDKKIEVRYPIAIKPHYLDSRMKNQGSCFTLFGYDKKGLINHPLNDAFLQKLIIPKNHFRKIKRDLFKLGISYDSIYPGVEGISKKINYSFDEYFC